MAEILPKDIVPLENAPASTRPKEGGDPGGGAPPDRWHRWSCLSCAAFGALAASIADLALKGGVSSVAKVSSGVNSGLGLPVLPIYVVLFFVALGIVIAWVNNVSDRKAALYAGASAISLFMTFVPNEIPKSLTTTVPPPIGHAAAAQPMPAAAWLIGAAQAQDNDRPASAPGSVNPSSIHLYVMDTGKHPVTDYTVTVMDAATKAVVGKSRYETPFITFSQPPGNYLLSIESPGYLSKSQELNIGNPTTFAVHVELQPTDRPDFVQRLFKKY